jgi:hypothetical protein
MKPLSALRRRKAGAIKFERRQRLLFFPHAGGVLLVCVMLLFGCAKEPARSGNGGNSVQIAAPTQVVSPVPTQTVAPPTITLKVINCPASLSSFNWDQLVGTKPHVNKVQQVMCGSLEGSGSLEALINVRYYSADARLDYYIYDSLFGTPTRTFSMLGLLNGDAQISAVGSIITAEVGPGDSLKARPDVFKEYQWQNGTFVQVLFPGIFPDMTHYQAEQDQAQLKAELAAGRKTDAWKATFFGPAEHLAKDTFHWTNISTASVTFSNHDGVYIVAVTNLGPGGGGFQARMYHLDYSITNIYEITQVTSIDGNVSINAPVAASEVSSPITVNGSALASGTILGKIIVYSDTYLSDGDSGDIHSPSPSGYVNFTSPVTYRLNSPGVQEGAVAFYDTNQNNTNASNQVVMIKVFLKA